ncbi:MAG: tetratricopeptide repeat protein [Planctomycetaceae bacterium]|nr:tetratricopeptide repeat protein [Planctomycetaceae bacterium]
MQKRKNGKSSAVMHRSGIVVSFFLVGMTAIVYLQTAGFGFVPIDDETYLTSNPRVWDGFTLENVRWAFTTTYFSNWHPLTWLSYMLDMELFGPEDPGGLHLMNVTIHTANVLLLFAALKIMTGELWKSAFVAAVFAVHPLRVESVAWISERKDLLSTFFGLLAILTYAIFVKRDRRRWFWASWILYAFSLMAKQMMVTLPFVLLLLDYWPLHRLDQSSATHSDENAGASVRRLIIEKWPFFLLTILGCVIAVMAQQTSMANASGLDLSWEIRCKNVIVVYGIYLLKTLWPTGLTVFYPFPKEGIAWFPLGLSLAVLTSISLLAIFSARKYPYLLVGWFWYLGTLVPVIGIVQIGGQRMADRYMYVPGIGLAILVAWLVPAVVPAGFSRRVLIPSVSVVWLAIMMGLSFQQATYWKNGTALFEHALAVGQPSVVAHYNLGFSLARQGQMEEAIHHYQEVLKLDPSIAGAHTGLGAALDQQGQFDEAINHYQESIRINSDDARVHYKLAYAFLQLKQYGEAIEQFREVARLNPEDPEIRRLIETAERMQQRTTNQPAEDAI